MAYSRRKVTDGVTVMNKDLYDNVQDGIDEVKEAHSELKKEFDNYVAKLPEDVKRVVLNSILVIE